MRKAAVYESRVQNFFFAQELEDDAVLDAFDEVFRVGGLGRIDLNTKDFLRVVCALMNVCFDPNDPIDSCFNVFATYDEINQTE